MKQEKAEENIKNLKLQALKERNPWLEGIELLNVCNGIYDGDRQVYFRGPVSLIEKLSASKFPDAVECTICVMYSKKRPETTRMQIAPIFGKADGFKRMSDWQWEYADYVDDEDIETLLQLAKLSVKQNLFV